MTKKPIRIIGLVRPGQQVRFYAKGRKTCFEVAEHAAQYILAFILGAACILLLIALGVLR